MSMPRVETKRAVLPQVGRALLAPAVWLERARGRRRLVLASAYVTVVALAGILLWRAGSLSGLPERGYPFDIRQLEYIRVPDDQNAFVVYREAAQLCVPLEQSLTPSYKANMSWSQATPELKEWVSVNRQALEVWERGTGRPRALYIDPREMTIETRLEVLDALRSLTRVADLEGSRLEEAGDLAGAWRVYRAMIRSSRHIATWGSMIQRLVGLATLRVAAGRINAWADQPRLTASQLRAALDEVIACEASTPPFSDALKVEYFAILNALARPDRWRRYDLIDDKLWFHHVPGGLQAHLFLRREPERSMRVARALFANWMAYCDTPPRQRRPPLTRQNRMSLFEPGIARAQTMSAATIDRWCEGTTLLEGLLPAFESCLGAVDSERSALAGLKVHLAEQVYLREHGKLPPQLEDLVGPYLDRLPDNYADIDPPAPKRAAKKRTLPPKR